MGATFSRLKNWAAEILTNEDLNAEIDNILTNLTPTGVDDHSTNTAQMKLQTSPGAVGTESLATSLAGELERLRYVIARITGETYWYTTPDTNINDIATALGNALYANRIESGRVVSGSNQPIYLVPHGTNATVTLKATTTPFVYYIGGTRYTLSADVVSSTLSTAPTSNNTGIVAAATGYAGEADTKLVGEYDSKLAITSPGTEWTNRVGQMAPFKVGAEYFIAKVGTSGLTLEDAFRGFFYDSADAGIPRVALTASDSVSIMKLGWMFVTTAGALTATYNPPYITGTQPTGVSVGDYWLDLTTGTWKYTTDGSNFTTANATFVGMAIMNSTGCVAARSFDFFKSFSDLNTVELVVNSVTVINTRRMGAETSVYGTNVRYQTNGPTWNIATDLDSGVTEAASTTYYLYLKENGDEVMSNVQPHDRRNDLKGFYHPYKAWRCVGEAYNNGSLNLVEVLSYYTVKDINQQQQGPVCQGRLTVSSGVAIPTTDQSAKTVIYFTPYMGNKVSLFEGGQWNTYQFRELSVTLPASTSTNYDIMLISSGGQLRLSLVQWVNGTTRVTSLQLQDGLYVSSADTARLYLGSVRTTGVSGQTEDSVTKRFLWNYFNRKPRLLLKTDSTDNWTYSTATVRQARADATNQVEILIGAVEDLLDLEVKAAAVTSTGIGSVMVGIGIGSTTVNSANLSNGWSIGPTEAQNINAAFRGYPAVGYQYYAWLEKGAGSNTQTWYGDAGTADGALIAGISGLVVC